MNTSLECLATCRPGLELAVEEELTGLGVASIRRAKRAVHFRTDRAGLYRVNMALRSAIQVLLPLRTFNARDYDLLYHQSRRTPWHQLFAVDKRVRVDVSGNSANLPNSQYTVHRIKDAIVDTFRKLSNGMRPSVDKANPDVHVVAHLFRDTVTLCLDSSGIPLFKRGYRRVAIAAPIKEDLAAGILLLSGLKPGQHLFDPMCGSGTFLFEGWMITRKIAPNTERSFAFQHWADYDEAVFCAEREALIAKRLEETDSRVEGADLDLAAVDVAESIRKQAFAGASIAIHHADLRAWTGVGEGGLMVVNPPYGERIGDPEALGELYRSIGHVAKLAVPGGRLAVFTTNRAAARQIRLNQDRSRTLFNGALEGVLYEYAVNPVA